jgi:hypothetical protein
MTLANRRIICSIQALRLKVDSLLHDYSSRFKYSPLFAQLKAACILVYHSARKGAETSSSQAPSSGDDVCREVASK